MMELITKINGNITGWDAKGETNKKTTDIKNEFNPDGSAKPVVDEFGFLIAALTGQWDRWNPKKQILSWTTGLFGFETPSPEEPPPPEKKKDSKMGVTTGSITEGMVASTADNAWAKPQTMATQFAKNAAVGQTKAYNTALAGGAPAVQGAAQKTFANPMILTFQDVYSMCVSLGAATGGKTADAVLRGINIALPGITGFRAQVKGAQGDYDKLKASGWSSGMGTGIGPWTGAMGGSKGAMAAAADRSRLGRPYISGGGSPPNSFDCSSLTQLAWRQA